jgi:hypothetical protein
MTAATQAHTTDYRVSDGYRWMQLAIGVIAMVMIATTSTGGSSPFPRRHTIRP